ncbi:hypothetical protein GUJ93_ZPchr0007g4591 [Zizania palustris]|uniref:Secreted protein n=1 Tax=Zizania palustris TaxID=103762 RepID=A0A8J5VPV5_ZIZPA|nr:hypothetical protein GUJ93_ZPchr0007g4591 [Zizania palustris]
MVAVVVVVPCLSAVFAAPVIINVAGTATAANGRPLRAAAGHARMGCGGGGEAALPHRRRRCCFIEPGLFIVATAGAGAGDVRLTAKGT